MLSTGLARATLYSFVRKRGRTGWVAGGLALVMAVGKKTGMIPEPLSLKIEQEVEERADVQGETSPAQQKLLALGGLGPAMDLTPSPQEEKPLTVGRRVMMHTMFGTVAAFSRRQA